ncbi:MAG: NosD domain-containing protein [Candidatus Heimdallarchaeaceae archaeon]
MKNLSKIFKLNRTAEALTMIVFIILGVGLPILLTWEKVDYIVIKSDKDFKKYKLPGEGTKTNPYVFANLSISNQLKRGIYIEGTTKYFVIRDCFFSYNVFCGIYIKSVKNGTGKIINNMSIGHSIAGIHVISSNSIEISNNTCTKNMYGIYLENSNNSKIQENYLFETKLATGQYGVLNTGIMIENSQHLNIQDNYFYKTSFGIKLEFGKYNKISNNLMDFVSHIAIGLVSSNENELINNTSSRNNLYSFSFINSSLNTITNCTSYRNNNGIYLFDSKENNIQFNVIEKNTLGLFALENSSENKIIYNSFIENEEQGVRLEITQSNIIHHNSFYDNNIDGLSQAKDSGNDNIWFDEEKLEGNFWKGWNTSSPYPIGGSANSTDPYPLTNPPTEKKTTYTNPTKNFIKDKISSSRTIYPEIFLICKDS